MKQFEADTIIAFLMPIILVLGRVFLLHDPDSLSAHLASVLLGMEFLTLCGVLVGLENSKLIAAGLFSGTALCILYLSFRFYQHFDSFVAMMKE